MTRDHGVITMPDSTEEWDQPELFGEMVSGVGAEVLLQGIDRPGLKIRRDHLGGMSVGENPLEGIVRSFETDPLGRSSKDPGSKLDAGKNRVGLMIHGFSRALTEVGRVASFGAEKYTPNGWMEVPQGVERYTDAMYRHLLAEATGEAQAPDSELLHAAHAAWNALARLELMLRT